VIYTCKHLYVTDISYLKTVVTSLFGATVANVKTYRAHLASEAETTAYLAFVKFKTAAWNESLFETAKSKRNQIMIILAYRLGIEQCISGSLQVWLATTASSPRVMKWIQIIYSGFKFRATSFRLSQFQNIKKIPILKRLSVAAVLNIYVAYKRRQ